MKKLLSLIIWFSVATVLAQGCIVGLSYFRGNLNRKTMTQMVALLNGIDIPGERLKNAIAEGQSVPIPTLDEILDAKVKKSLELDSREKALERWHRQLQEEQNRQEAANKDLTQRISEHDAAVKEFKRGQLNESLAEVQKILEVLSPDMAKVQMLRMVEDGAMTDVLAIIKAMQEGTRKKILAEFTQGDDSAKLGEIINALRAVETKPVSTPVAPNDPNSPST
jgi:hypothetical protein